MKKYLYIFKSELMTNLQYVTNVLSGFIGYLIHIIIFLYLWKYIYDDPQELINGYSLNQMVWYVIITEILWSTISGRKLCKKIVDDVRGGNIAYSLNKPYNYIFYNLSSHLGSSLVKLMIYIILSMILGYIFLGSFPSHNIISIILVLISALLAIIISIFLITTIGFISFFIEDSSPFYWLYSKFILVLGTLFPIEYFPKKIRPIITYSPIFVVSYGPAKLFVDFSYHQSVKILSLQIIYVLISYLICLLVYRKGVKKLNVNGG